MTHDRSRRNIPILLAASVALLTSVTSSAQTEAATASSGDWTTNGPAAGPVLSLAADPRDPSRLFAGTEYGLFRSNDGGQSWSASPTGPRGVFALAVAAAEPSRVYLGTSGGVATSLDGGSQFSTAALGTRITALVIDPRDSSTVYSAGSGSVIGKTSDGGLTWSSHAIDSPTVKAIATLIVDPRNSTILAGVTSEGSDESSYYYAAPAGVSPASIIGSGDGGQTWRVFLPGGGAPQRVRALARDPLSPDVVYASKGDTIYRSSDAGATWTGLSPRLGSEVTSLIVDASAPGTLYAGTDDGIRRSVDSGAHWASLPGVPPVGILALVLDPQRQILHAGTGRGVYEIALSALAGSPPCARGVDRLCLLRGRFQVELEARDPRTGHDTTGTAVAENDSFGYFSLPAFTGDALLPEVLVKMVDAGVPPWNSDWVFFSGLTDVSYLLTVTDTATGATRTYSNDPLNPYCGGADTSAFPSSSSGSVTDRPIMQTQGSTGNTLSLLSDRFRLTLNATDPRTGRSANGAAIAANDRFGFFSLPTLTGDPGLPEVFVKMIDARLLTGSFWLFQTGLTDLAYTLSVTDSSTGEVREYRSPGAFCGSADTDVGP